MLKRREEEEKILDMNATMQGNLVFSEPVNLRINGKFEGNLNTKGTLIIGELATINAEIIGEEIIIGGKVNGKIKSSKSVVLKPTAIVYADIETPRLAVEGGAIFNGNCKMGSDKLTIEELADYLSVEIEKVKDWINTGRIPFEKEGEKVFFDRKEVETWVSQQH